MEPGWVLEPDSSSRSSGRTPEVLPEKVLGPEVARRLLHRGFCSLSWHPSTSLYEALGEVAQLEERGRLERPSDDIVEGLLGATGSLRHTCLGEPAPSAKSPPRSQPSGRLEGWGAAGGAELRILDGRLTGLQEALQPWAPSVLGFTVGTRSPAVLLECGNAAPWGSSPVLQGKECWKWLKVFQRHRIMAVMFVGPGSASLELKPFEEASKPYVVEMRPNSCVLLRADLLSHKLSMSGHHQDKGYALCSYFLQTSAGGNLGRKSATAFQPVPVAERLEASLLIAAKALKETTDDEYAFEAATGRDLQRIINRLIHKGQQIAIRGWACRFSACTSRAPILKCMLFAGTDCATEVPMQRWDHSKYYDPEPKETYGYSTVCRHACFVEGIEFFDNKFFGLSPLEAKGMDPNHRMTLEVCYEVFFNAGLKKSSLMRSNIGVYTGGPAGIPMEWGQVPRDQSGADALASTSGSPAILSNRISYTFGLNGPNFLMDMDGAASLLALHLATDALQRSKPQCTAAICLGSECVLSPAPMFGLNRGSFLSRLGRCLAFDSTADGYIRGEGFGGVHLNPLMITVNGERIIDQTPQLLGVVSGTCSNNNGRSASLTAPSGAADQGLLAMALRSADVSPLDIDSVDCEGYAAPLNDAVEVMALCRGYRNSEVCRADDPELLALTASKSSMGNCRPSAGIVAVMRVLAMQALGCTGALMHLYRLNSQLHSIEDAAAPVLFVTEALTNRSPSAFCGITAKSMSGSNAHAILYGTAVSSDVKEKPAPEREAVSYWPGGGGELPLESQPRRCYCVTGSWRMGGTVGMSEEAPEPMRREADGSHRLTVTIGEHGFERFQIWLDGDPQRVLHPTTPWAGRDEAAEGPSYAVEAAGLTWFIGSGFSDVPSIGRPGGMNALKTGGDGDNDADGEDMSERMATKLHNRKLVPGDRYEVQLLVSGKYRTVTWEPLGPSPLGFKAGRYFLAASWSDWQPRMMLPVKDASGALVYTLEVRIRKNGGCFQIVRNKDWDQILYPKKAYAEDGDSCPVMGPDESGAKQAWQLKGSAGDVVKFQLRLEPRSEDWATVNGEATPSSSSAYIPKVSWQLIRSEVASKEELSQALLPQYFLVGSWDSWRQRIPMVLDRSKTSSMGGNIGGSFLQAELPVRAIGSVIFHILEEGDWNRYVNPSRVIAGEGVARDHSWHIEQAEVQSCRLTVRMELKAGQPYRISLLEAERRALAAEAR